VTAVRCRSDGTRRPAFARRRAPSSARSLSIPDASIMPVPDDGGAGPAGVRSPKPPAKPDGSKLLASICRSLDGESASPPSRGCGGTAPRSGRSRDPPREKARSLRHTIPEGRLAPRSTRTRRAGWRSRRFALRLGLDVTRGQAREISAHPSKLKARTDWTFTFVGRDGRSVATRRTADRRGDRGRTKWRRPERSCNVPEEWQRRVTVLRPRATRFCRFSSACYSAACCSAARSHRRESPGAGTSTRRGCSSPDGLDAGGDDREGRNDWPVTLASLITAAPLPPADCRTHRCQVSSA